MVSIGNNDYFLKRCGINRICVVKNLIVRTHIAVLSSEHGIFVNTFCKVSGKINKLILHIFIYNIC